MRKLVILSLLIAIVQQAVAQQPAAPTGTVIDTTYYYNWNGSDWIFFKRQIFSQFTTAEYWKKSVIQFYKNNKWNDSLWIYRSRYYNGNLDYQLQLINYNGTLDTLSYIKKNEQGQTLVKLTKSFAAPAPSGFKTVYSYSDNGSLQSVFNYTWNGQNWLLVNKIIAEYADTLLSNLKFYSLNDSSGTFNLIEKISLFYTNGRLDSSLDSQYFPSPVLYQKTVYLAYYPDGKVKQYEVYEFNGSGVSKSRLVYQHYDANGNIDTLWSKHWYDTAWIDTVRFTVYSNGKPLIDLSKSWGLNSSRAFSGTKKVYEYDQNNNLTNFEIYNWDGYTWQPSSKTLNLYDGNLLM